MAAASVLAAASGASAADSSGDEEPDFADVLNRDWRQWRAIHPVRACAPAPGGIRTPQGDEPLATTVLLPDALSWNTYWESGEVAGSIRRECLVVPYANLVDCKGCPGAAEPLAGEKRQLHSYPPNNGGPGMMQEYTNVLRINQLALDHPLVGEVDPYRICKAAKRRKLDPVTLRAKWGHQSEFDLKMTLAATGAIFYMGVSVQGVKDDQVKLWYVTGKTATKTNAG